MQIVAIVIKIINPSILLLSFKLPPIIKNEFMVVKHNLAKGPHKCSFITLKYVILFLSSQDKMIIKNTENKIK